MGRRKTYRDDYLKDVKTEDFEITYDALFKNLKKYNISQIHFCETCGISTNTFQKIRHNIQISYETIKKIITGLNKVHPKKKHQFNDVFKCKYKK